VSGEEGDGAGFDIASFDRDGSERLIEVKTTNGWGAHPFHISSNELAVADNRRTVPPTSMELRARAAGFRAPTSARCICRTDADELPSEFP
jgi:hypothetical protein